MDKQGKPLGRNPTVGMVEVECEPAVVRWELVENEDQKGDADKHNVCRIRLYVSRGREGEQKVRVRVGGMLLLFVLYYLWIPKRCL